MSSGRRMLLCLTLSCAAVTQAQDGPIGPSASAASPVAALAPLHMAATVPGGVQMAPLRCATPSRTPQKPPRPAEGGSPPAGSDEEELALTDQQEQELRKEWRASGCGAAATWRQRFL